MTQSHPLAANFLAGNIWMNLSSRLLSGVVTFATVVDAGSFRGAARLLGITPSGVSRGVSRLEAQLGVRLFNRHPRGHRQVKRALS
jgi:Bacterial regulatory helix-turn-helix protein, lysR family